MKRGVAILAVALATWLAGCSLHSKPKAVAAAPPRPQPAAAVPAVPQPPPSPLSIPQTQVQLPPPQPVNPDALVTPPPEPPPETSPAAPGTRAGRTRNPSSGGAPAPPKPEAAPPAPAPTPTVEPPRQPIQEMVPQNEQKQLQDSAEGRRKVVQQWLDGLGQKRMTRHQQTTVLRMRAFLKDSEEAEARGDMRQADALAERAQILLRELQNGQ